MRRQGVVMRVSNRKAVEGGSASVVEILERRWMLSAASARVSAAQLHQPPAIQWVPSLAPEAGKTPIAPGWRPTFQLIHQAGSLKPAETTAPVGISPAALRHAYEIDKVSFGSVVGDGIGQTIAIVDAYHAP